MQAKYQNTKYTLIKPNYQTIPKYHDFSRFRPPGGRRTAHPKLNIITNHNFLRFRHPGGRLMAQPKLKITKDFQF